MPARHTLLTGLGCALLCGSIPSAAGGAITGGNIITGAGSSTTHVKRFDAPAVSESASFLAYPGVTSGVHVAAGDINGDGVAELITGLPAGSGPTVRAFSGTSLSAIRTFDAYTPSYTGGVFVAAGDVNGDGFADIYTSVASGAAPHVKVFDGPSGAEYASFFAYPATYMGGVRIAAGDVTGDGSDDIVTATAGGTSGHVKVFNGATLAESASFFPYGAGFTGGVFVASGDINGDGFDDIVTGTDAGSTAHIKAFSGAGGAELASFFAFPVGFNGGVRVAAADLTGDGRAEIIAGSGTASATVKVFDGLTGAELSSFFAYPSSAGVFVAATSVPEPAFAAPALLALLATRARRRPQR